MKGFIVRYSGREYRAGFPDKMTHVVCDIIDGIFSLDVVGGEYFIKSNRIAKEGIEVEIEVGEFDEPSAVITEENRMEVCPVDPEYEQLVAEQNSEEWLWKKKLEIFRRTEAVLKEEGLI